MRGGKKIFLAIVFTLALSLAFSATLVVAAGAVGDEFDIAKRNCEEWATKTGNKIVMFQSPNLTNDRLGLFQQIFAAKSDEIDIVQIDVIWPGLLGKYFVDLNKYIPKSHSNKHFKPIIDNNTNPDGELLAMPFFTDAGILYYRKDLLDKYGKKPPTTWEELEDIAKDILKKEKNDNLVGFVFQGKAYEGLTCDALEWIDSYGGGEIIDPNTGDVTVNNPKAIKAIKTAAGWVGTIAPKGVLNYAEEDARGIFQSGNAIFMRNWPYAWSLSQGDDSRVKDKVGVVALPKGGNSGKHTGTLGGWNMAVSKYSKNKKEAADLVRYLTTPEMQLKRAIEGSYNPTISEVYDDSRLADAAPFMARLKSTFTNAVARPSKLTGRSYNKVSNKFWNAVHSVLSGEKTAEKSMEQLEKDLNRIKGRKWK
eukprot:CAMPEP_0201284576 /NCGR_PEP_ID=MMETSP1317-20130820/78307_1 /ASSEMBLY_ACC=CAM_ASM_000770 /TAXON_ID=187299 /ORGANISM="Undescribed Undescribed, Strain Undescribed" /LENGTH=421 /DNA_ID=CAMNT_0047605257 /DNA_START=87 /DNA_END=1352 /DNA_ORIENTATION=+